ncbi:hypothetical protein [Edaphobacter modestus]|uniref:Uncharacterized protein n=1 Tax=Edaphobacter modestus TaxID=388466 RepID=A0A4Q7Y0G7_9BACT|nr:hypothetical protein [Edaphobacter modestus]RZU29049.1 hypothetical protein BDD14_6643 [Edaphobacter modestus]
MQYLKVDIGLAHSIQELTIFKQPEHSIPELTKPISDMQAPFDTGTDDIQRLGSFDTGSDEDYICYAGPFDTGTDDIQRLGSFNTGSDEALSAMQDHSIPELTIFNASGHSIPEVTKPYLLCRTIRYRN